METQELIDRLQLETTLCNQENDELLNYIPRLTDDAIARQEVIVAQHDELVQRYRATIERCADIEQKLEEQHDEEMDEYDRLGQVIENLQEHAETISEKVLEAAQAATDEIDDEPESICDCSDQLISKFKEMQQQADDVASELADAFDDLKQTIAEKIAAVGTVTSEVQDDGDRIQSRVQEEILPAITERSESFVEQLNTLGSNLTETVDELQRITTESNETTVAEVVEQLGDNWQSLVDRTEALGEVLTRIGSLIQDFGEIFGETKETLLDGVQTVNLGAKVSIGLFEEVVELLTFD